MKFTLIAILCFTLLFPVLSQSNSDYKSTILKSEQFPKLTIDAVKLAAKRKLPTSISIKGKAFIQPVIVKNNEVIYSVVTDILYPIENGYLANFKEIENMFDLKYAKIKYFEDRKKIIKSNSKILAPGDSIYLIPESTNDRIMAFSANNGDIFDLNFVVPDTTNNPLNLPIDAKHHRVRNSLVVSDQVNDIVQEFDSNGDFLGTFAPTDTVNQILDNIRGMAFHPNTNLLVTVAGGVNEDAIAEFDFFGNYLRNFIQPNDTQMNSPFDVLIRTTDILVSGINSNGVHRYEMDGNYIDDFATGVPFPEQITELSNGEIAVSNFTSPNSGIQIYTSSGGTYTQLLTGITGNRGVAELANGNLLTTNSSGVYLIDRSSGNVIETKVDSVSARFISLYVVDDILFVPVVKILSDTLKFGSVFFDSTKTDSLYVRNYGNSELEINDVYSNHTDISISPDTGNIAIGDSMLFEVSFSAISDSSTEEGIIVFQSNAPSSPDTIEFVANLVTGFNRFESTIPQSHSLSQNYPNPFNPETLIKYQIPKSGFINLTIYNVQGQKVTTLVNNDRVTGKHSVIWNASEFASGVYYLVLKAGQEFSETKKMLLIK